MSTSLTDGSNTLDLGSKVNEDCIPGECLLVDRAYATVLFGCSGGYSNDVYRSATDVPGWFADDSWNWRYEMQNGDYMSDENFCSRRHDLWRKFVNELQGRNLSGKFCKMSLDPKPPVLNGVEL